MKSKLPATPLDALKISGALRMIVKTIHSTADVFGFWKRPSSKASADFESMSLLDKIYWGYKSKKPVLLPDKHSSIESYFQIGKRNLELPEGFQTEQTVTFSGVGDLIKVDGLENSKDILYDNVSDLIFDKDISYGNLESQLTGQDIGGYTFSDKETPPLCCTIPQYDTLRSYKGKQFTIFHTACNHTLDMGLEGLETTLKQLEKDSIVDLGTNRTPEDQYKCKIIEKNGIKLGFISATYGLNGKTIPPGKEYMVNVVKFHRMPAEVPGNNKPHNADLTLLTRQIEDCKAHGCDIIIASLHWGYEYELFPRQHQIEIAHELVEAGVDVILSHHAHVIQPIEYYKPKRNPEKTAVIAYSLGNLTSSFSALHIILSGILNLTFIKGHSRSTSETVLIKDCTFTPVVQLDEEKNGLPMIRLERVEDLLQMTGHTSQEEQYRETILRHLKSF